jgi:hypothetical protein
LDSYLVKNDRGDVNRENRDFDDTYWRERNDMAYEDRSILRYLPALEAEMAALKSLPGIAALHEEACALHRAKRDRLLTQPDYISMRDQLKRAGTMSPKEEDLVRALGIAPLPSPYAGSLR